MAPVVTGSAKFLLEVHLESLGIEETRLAQVVQLLDALDVTCPEVRVGATANGWVAAAQDERMTLRAHCVASAALAPALRIRVNNAALQCVVELPMGAEARPLVTTVRAAGGTETVIGKYESPARAFWLGLAANHPASTTETPARSTSAPPPSTSMPRRRPGCIRHVTP